jgi:hypothetical protein
MPGASVEAERRNAAGRWARYAVAEQDTMLHLEPLEGLGNRASDDAGLRDVSTPVAARRATLDGVAREPELVVACL